MCGVVFLRETSTKTKHLAACGEVKFNAALNASLAPRPESG